MGGSTGLVPNNIIFDHVSCMWNASGSILFGIPSVGSPSGDDVKDVTVSNSIMGQPVPYRFEQDSGQASTPPGGSCTSAQVSRTIQRCSFVGNYIAHTSGQAARFWDVDGGEVINNIVYNFDSVGLQAKARSEFNHQLDLSIIGNLIQHGPDSKPSSSELFRPIDLSGNTGTDVLLEVAANHVGQLEEAPTALEDPLFDRVTEPPTAGPSPVRDILAMAQPSSDHLRCLGASRPQRDTHDQRAIDEFLTGAGAILDGSDQVRDFSQYPTQPVRQSWADVDSDGIPDTWEQKLSIDDPGGNDLSAAYTNVEVFLNGLAQCPNISVATEDGTSFSSATEVAILFNSSWLTWADGQTIEVCIDTTCVDYADPDNDQRFVAAGLSPGSHTATFTLQSTSGASLAVADEVSFTIS